MTEMIVAGSTIFLKPGVTVLPWKIMPSWRAPALMAIRSRCMYPERPAAQITCLTFIDLPLNRFAVQCARRKLEFYEG